MSIHPTAPTVHPAARLAGDQPAPCAHSLHLFDGPYLLRDGRRVDVPEGSKRLVVFVALHGARVERRHAAGAIWPGGDDLRAAGNLRSALWRLRAAGIEILTNDKYYLALDQGTAVDVWAIGDWASRLIEGRPVPEDLRNLGWRPAMLDLLPGWYDDWVVFERERLRQRVLHGLEALARQLARTGRTAEAVEAALTAVAVEPLRETSQRVLIETHLAEGNIAEARRAYAAYRGLVRRELGVEPGPRLQRLILQAGAVPAHPG